MRFPKARDPTEKNFWVWWPFIHLPLLLQEILGEISCDNMAALHQAGKNRKRVGIGVKHSDLH